MHVLSNHNNKVYRDHPVTCTFEPPTRNRYSSELGDNDARCSGVMELLARPWNHAPTMYAAPVSSPYTTYTTHRSATPVTAERNTHTRQQHQIIICLKVSRTDHDPSRYGSKSNDNDGYRQKCKRLGDEVTHDDGCRERCTLCFFLLAKERDLQAPIVGG